MESADCVICKCTFDTSSLLQTSGNEFYCKDCFKHRLCNANRTYAAGDTKNNTRLLQRYNHNNNCKSQKLIPCPEMYVKVSEFEDKFDLTSRALGSSTVSLSKRPIQCPKDDCNKYISIFTLENHFKHEHKEVPIVSTHLDARCATDFYPKDVRYGIVQCSVLLKILNGDHLQACASSKTLSASDNPNPIMILLATRIPAYRLYDSNDYMNNDMQDSDVSYDSAKTAVMENEPLYRPGDKIVVWLASNIATNMSYTVAVSTLDNEIRQKYFGPLMTLNETPENLCREGNCLILTDIHCIRMTENETKPLALDVVVHGPD